MPKKVLTIKDKQEEKFLRKRAADFDFSKMTLKERQALINEMKEIMKSSNGIGLSANQIGLDMQLFVAQVPQDNKKKYSTPKFYAIFNPQITKFSKTKAVMEEGCLSVPGVWGDVDRPDKITLTGFDKNQKAINIKAFGLLAKVFQHEFDHLNGILFIDKAQELHTYKEEANETGSGKMVKIKI